MVPRTHNHLKWIVIAGIVTLGYALLAHMSTLQGGNGPLGALLAIGPVGLFGLAFAWRSGRRLVALIAWLLATALIAAHWHQLEAQFVWVYLIQQVGIYGLLGLTFGRTLALNRVPLCTQMALRVHGALSTEALRYTRLVTVAWALLFAVSTAMVIFLFWAAPLKIWSAFANFGTPVLVMIMFLIENRVRRHALPNMAHVGVIATIRASATGGFEAVEPRS